MRICRALRAVACVVQLPPSFTATNENLLNAASFFACAEKGPQICIELRHPSWFKHVEQVMVLAQKIGAVHVTDPLVRLPTRETEMHYFRLHGLGKALYKYQYGGEELSQVLAIAESLGGEKCYVMFNNTNMLEDARRFRTISAPAERMQK